MTKKQIINAIKGHQKRIAKERDGLRDLLYEMEDLEQKCDQAYDELQSCIDSLSETL